MRLSVNNLNYHLKVCGEGPPLLLLHGFTGSGSNWEPFCSTIGEKSTLIMPDIIGHGKTESPEQLKSYDMESVANDLWKMIDKLGYEKVDILGYSMGGRLALAMAIVFPARVRKLILESASPGLKTIEERTERQFSDRQLANFISEKGVEAFIKYWENISLFQSQKLLPCHLQAAIHSQRLNNSHIGLANSLLGMGTGSQPSYWGRLSEIQAEVLLIVGEHDQKFCQIALEMQKNLKKGQIYKMVDAGHAIHIEQSEKFGTIVSEFLDNTY